MRRTLKNVAKALDERANTEWDKLQELYQATKCGEAEPLQVSEQRARWAAWDTAAGYAAGREDI
jgi:hypothetical protein